MTTEPPGDFPANAEQAAYWNELSGPRWVELQAAIDQRLEPFNAMLAGRAGTSPGHKVLDIGCGTGALALHLAERVGPGGAVLGVDLSAPMLARAEHRRAEHDVAHLRFRRLDAQTHAFDPGAFDVLASRFGVMFFSDPVAAFGNLRRALRPEGRLAFVAWAPIEGNPWFEIPTAVGVRRLGPPEPQPRRAPGPFAFSDAAYVEQILSAAGFAEIIIERITTVLPGPPTAAAEAEFVQHMGPLARLIREREPDAATVRQIVAEIAEGFRQFETAAGMRVPASVYCVTAVRP
jgi:ubiquinone/menaquinone biosynthesis C-methylase UbiE